MNEAPVPQELRDFLDTFSIAICLGSPVHDHHLVFANTRFVDLTGYGTQDLIGRNCRFLQRDTEDRQAHAKLRAFLDDEAMPSVRAPLINFRKDGTPFVNLLYMSRLRAKSGETRYILTSQFDVSRVLADRLRAYDHALVDALTSLEPIATENGIVVDKALTAIGDAISLMAQAQITLDP